MFARRLDRMPTLADLTEAANTIDLAQHLSIRRMYMPSILRGIVTYTRSVIAHCQLWSTIYWPVKRGQR